jgi:hypothetical protein
MAVRKKDGGAFAPTEEAVPEVLHTVSIRVKKPHTRRWRAGMCFTQEPRVESVRLEVLAQIEADDLLIVEPIEPAQSEPAGDGQAAESGSPTAPAAGA